VKRVIVDTNVPVVANQRLSPQASLECVATCVRAIRAIQTEYILVIDDAWHILREYRNNLRSSGQPGVGDAFLKWVLTNQANPHRCEQVHITLSANRQDDNDFDEFPDDPNLSTFDRSDRKFVAVAIAHPQKPPILNATDTTDWWTHVNALARYGLQIDFLCPETKGKVS
jgi:hypothetical protein